jgi:DNA replication protein DnaC
MIFELTEEQISRRLREIGRPVAETFAAVLNRGLMAELAQRQHAWDLANPALLVERLGLLDELERRSRKATELALREAQALMAARRLRALCGERLADGVLTAQPTQPLLAAQEWRSRPGRPWSLVLLGGTGNGKSTAAAALAHQSLTNGERVNWLNVGEESLRQAFGPEADERARWQREADLCVIDDLGAGATTEVWTSWLSALLTHRHANNRATVVTSNLDGPALKALVGARLEDRLREGVVVVCGAGSMRRR